jgi:hypothetical protein
MTVVCNRRLVAAVAMGGKRRRGGGGLLDRKGATERRESTPDDGWRRGRSSDLAEAAGWKDYVLPCSSLSSPRASRVSLT